MLFRKIPKWLIVLLPLLFLFGHSNAQSQSGMIREYYACNYLEGKDINDLMAARDYMVEQIGGNYEGTTFLWTPIKANNDFDFLWFNQYTNLSQWGSEIQALWNTPVYLDVIQRFESMSNCVTGMVTHVPIFEGGAFQVANNSGAIVESFACTLKDGGDLAGVNSAVEHWRQVVTGLGAHSNYNAFMQIPFVSSAGRDVFYFGVYPDFEAYAAGTTTLQNSSDHTDVLALFARQHRCDSSLWEGRPIVQP